MRKFIDTAPFIYIIEDNEEFAEKSIEIILESIAQQDTFVTSVVTIMEFGVKPEKENRQDVIEKFYEFLDKLSIEIEDIDQGIAKQAFKLRAKYQFLKGLDALQIASAIISGCEEFVTNDRKLKQISEISVVLIEEK